jgi:penicillin-binding protein 1C
MPIKLRSTRALPFNAPHFVNATLSAAPYVSQVTTSLGSREQLIVERQIKSYVARQARIGIKNAAALLIDARSMQVKAWVGSADFFDSRIDGQVNGVLAKRSPGSALKPFIYGLALDQGLIHPRTILKDAPASFGAFSPENFDGTFQGPIAAEDALIHSRNVPAVSLAASLTHPTLYQFLKTAGVSDLRPENYYGLALALGGAEVSMLELAQLYASLANGGILRPARLTATEPDVPGTRVLSEAASFIVLDMLSHNPRPDQAFAAEHTRGNYIAAWKTGTSWGFRDAWAAGVFGPFVLVVWAGNFDGHGNPAFVGISAAAPLFFDISDALRISDPAWAPRPMSPPATVARLAVCAASGQLPNAECPQTVSTWFIPGRSPIAVSELHRAFMIDTRNAQIACPPYDLRYVRRVVYEVWPSDLLRLFALAGLPRRSPPPLDARCDPERMQLLGAAPRITSPLRGVIYTVRLAAEKNHSLTLRATADAEAQEIFWFAGPAYLGKATRGSDLSWTPSAPGEYLLRAVDNRGRSDSRAVRVAWEQ